MPCGKNWMNLYVLYFFKNIEAMMSNIEMVNEHLKSTDYKYETLAFIKTKSNTNLLFDSTNTPWRVAFTNL